MHKVATVYERNNIGPGAETQPLRPTKFRKFLQLFSNINAFLGHILV